MPSALRHPLFAVCGLLVLAANAFAQPDGAAVLAKRGLMRSNRVWMLPLEIELRDALANLPRLRDSIGELERELEGRIEQNRAKWQESQGNLQSLRQARSKLKTDDPQRAVLDQQIAAASAAAVEPSRLGGRADVRSAIVAWSAERNTLMASLRFLRAAVPRLHDEYAALTREPQIGDAVAALGGKQRLGPQRSYEADVQRLGEYERLVFNRWTPIHWLGGHVRVMGLFEDRAPITFSLLESGEQATLLTTTAAETAGLAVPADAPRASILLAPGRQVIARRVELPYLRFGGCELRGVAAYVLPPEAEDWGCRISRSAFGERKLRLEPERFRLWIEG